MANPELLMKLRSDNIDKWQRTLSEFETVLLPGYEKRMELLVSMLGSDGLDSRLYEIALEQLHIDPRDFNSDRLNKSGYAKYLWVMLNSPLNMAFAANEYYEAYRQGDDNTVVTAESSSPSFGRRLGMLGAERLLIIERNFLALDRSTLNDDHFDQSSAISHPKNFKLTLDDIREGQSLYAGLKTIGHTPVEPEELVGVTMRVVQSLHT